MTDRTRITIIITALVVVLGAVLTAAGVYRANAHTIIEQFGRAEADTCPEGWGPSWAYWPNDHTGGFVCTREIDHHHDEPAAPAAPSARYDWLTLGVNSLTAGGVLGPSNTSGYCTVLGGVGDPLAFEMRPSTDILIVFDSVGQTLTITNVGASTVTAELFARCQV